MNEWLIDWLFQLHSNFRIFQSEQATAQLINNKTVFIVYFCHTTI